MVNPPTQTYSFSSQQGSLEPSQLQQNFLSNPSEAIRRVTLRQLIDASQVNFGSPPKFIVDGVPIKKITVVANVRYHVDKGASGRIYNFDDGTGKFQGRFPDTSYNFTYEPFAYARITGELERHNGTTMLRVDNIQLVLNSYEIYYHILHSIFDTLTAARGPPSSWSSSDIWNEHELLPSQLDALTIGGGSPNPSEPDTELLEIMNNDEDPLRLAAIQHIAIACLTDPDVQHEDNGVFIGIIMDWIEERYDNPTFSEIWHAMELLIERDLVYSDVHLFYEWKT